jgi:nitroreductase
MLQTSRKLPERLHEHLASPEFHVFYHAPVLVVIAAKAGDWAVENATLAAENLMLAAYGQGLGSCWIGFAQHWLGTEEGREAIALDEGYMPVAPIILGYPSAIALPVARNRPRLRWID